MKRQKLDRRRLEAAHLLYAVLTVSLWYPHIIPSVCLDDDLDSKLLQLISPYHRAFSEKYAGTYYKFTCVDVFGPPQ